MFAYTRFEVLRTLRSTRFLVVTMIMPAVMFLWQRLRHRPHRDGDRRQRDHPTSSSRAAPGCWPARRSRPRTCSSWRQRCCCSGPARMGERSRLPDDGHVSILTDLCDEARREAPLFDSERRYFPHINNLFSKIGSRDRAQAVAYAFRNGLATPEER
jgi:hypothetical protein